MPTFLLQRPLLPSHYRVLIDPPDDKGDETLTFVSVARRIKLRGHSFREFRKLVLPLLDGRHTLPQIADACKGEFALGDLEDALNLLTAHGLLRDAALDDVGGDPSMRLPQWNQWHDLGADPAKAQVMLGTSTVVVVGLVGAGAVAAQALAASGVGSLRLIDSELVHKADTYLAAAYAGAAGGRLRADVLAERLKHQASDVNVHSVTEPFSDDDALAAAVAGSNFVVCCLDDGRNNLAYRLNRVCLQLSLPWLVAGTAGTEAWVGPLMRPPATPCYLCFRMRMVAASESPEDEYALASHLDRQRRDASASHESLVFGEGIAGQLAALEAVKMLCELPAQAAAGQFVVFDLIALTTTRHKVLRKPWCPACQKLAWVTE